MGHRLPAAERIRRHDVTQKQFALIEFHGDQLLTILEDGVQRVAIKPIAESLGVAWPRQYTKIMGDEVLSKGVTLTVIPSERGGLDARTAQDRRWCGS